MDKELLRKELGEDEGQRLLPYTDTVGKLTIGVGRNLSDRGISEAESDYLLDNDIAIVEAGLDNDMPWWRQMSDNRQRVLANMAFNLGLSRLKLFVNTLNLMKEGKYDACAIAMLKSNWAKQVPKRAGRLAQRMADDGAFMPNKFKDS